MLKEFHNSAELSAAEVDTGRLVLLAIRNARDLTGVEYALGVKLPQKFNTACGTSPRAIWISPNRWMIAGCISSVEDIENSASAAAALAVEISDGRFAVELVGPKAQDVLARCCSLDLHERAFSAGQTAMTLFAQVPVLLDKLDRERFRLYFDSGCRDYVCKWIARAITNVA